MTGRWSKWSNVETPSRREGPAIYKIRITANGRPITIPRFLEQDRTGILSIGMTGLMENRRHQFLAGIRKGHGHSEANLLHLLLKHTQLRTRFAQFELQYSFCPVPTRDAAKEVEALELKKYVIHYGEVPPLNSAIPERYSHEW